MIKGISIPVLTPYKFYPATDITLDGVNFQNIDNVEYHSQEWFGVYTNQWTQPVPKYWYDYTPGIDFQVYFEDTDITYADLSAAIINTAGTIVQTLSKETTHVYVAGDKFQVRFYATELLGVNDGFYRIKIYESGSDDVYLSEIIEIKETHSECYPLQYSNFENDFGLVFSSGSTSFTGKILIPSRSYKPVPASEMNKYMNDNGIMTTLRSVTKRIYQLESSLVPAWFYEKIALIFSCSELTFNKYEVNSAEIPDSNLFEGSDTVTFSTDIELTEFPDKDTYLSYQYQENIDAVTELLTGWTENSGAGVIWDFLTFDGKDITIATFSGAGTGVLTSNSISLTSGQNYIFNIEFINSTFAGVFEIEIGTASAITYDSFVNGQNTIIHTANTTENTTIRISMENGTSISAICSMKKIN